MAPRAKAITGTFAVALLLAFTRWGSYIGVAPLFLTDVLIALAVINQLTRKRSRLIEGRRSYPGVIITLFLGLVIMRALTSTGFAFSMPWLRDVTPFLYAFLAFLSAASMAKAAVGHQEKTMKYLWWALIVHLMWVSFMAFFGLSSATFPRFPGAAVPILTLRPDVDVAVIGVTAGLALRRIVIGHSRKLSVMLLITALATATQFGSRAGLISVALSLVTALAVAYASLPKSAPKRAILVLLVPVALFAGLAGLAQTTAGERLIASTFEISATGSHGRNAQGTQQARQLSWEGVVDWTMDGTSRALVGSGFGNDFLSQSGVLQFLQGTDYTGVRSPHNWLVGVFARLGLIGFTLAASILFLLARNVLRYRQKIGGNELTTMASLIVIGFMPVALLGVVLESPFGAVPFWWAAGIVLAMQDSTKPSRGHQQEGASNDRHAGNPAERRQRRLRMSARIVVPIAARKIGANQHL